MNANVKIEGTWKKILAPEFKKPYFTKLFEFVQNEYDNEIVYPTQKNIFRAFELCPFEKVRVVILGQDPYHGAKQANGLAFSVNEKIPLPPSLQNIYKEMASDLGGEIPKNGDLIHLAKQGVFLLNSTLTVRADSAGSHQKKGWEEFTDVAIKELSERKENLVFILWGKYAENKGAHIDTAKHLVLTAPHPSPLSVYNGFFGCKHFSKTNKYLKQNGKEEIHWV